jgi:acetate kinase
MPRIFLKKQFQLKFSRRLKGLSGCLRFGVKFYIKSYWPEISDISHRILEGGDDYQQPILINQINFESLAASQKYAPAANQVGLQCLQECLSKFPQARNFAVFESACLKRCHQ